MKAPPMKIDSRALATFQGHVAGLVLLGFGVLGAQIGRARSS